MTTTTITPRARMDVTTIGWYKFSMTGATMSDIYSHIVQQRRQGFRLAGVEWDTVVAGVVCEVVDADAEGTYALDPGTLHGLLDIAERYLSMGDER